jgi:hypothetical protein
MLLGEESRDVECLIDGGLQGPAIERRFDLRQVNELPIQLRQVTETIEGKLCS